MSDGKEIRCSRLIVGDGRVIDDCRVGIRGGLIQEISQATLRGSYIESYDFTGKTIMPGLVDAHVHVRYGPKADATDLPDEYQAIRAVGNMRKALYSGVTSLVDAGGIRNLTFSLRRAQREGVFLGPRLFVCGEMITITGGRSSKPGVRLYEVDGADSARRVARTLLMHHNADFLKLGATGAISAAYTGPKHPQLTTEEMRAVCEEAHACNRMVHAHCYGSEGMSRAFASGVEVIVHGQTLSDPQLLEMTRRGMFLIPTLKPYIGAIEEGTDASSKSRLLDSGIWEETEPNFRRAIATNVKIAMGTDSGMPGVLFGDNSRELEYMVRWGMTNAQALAAGTVYAAMTVGAEKQIGTLEPGKYADLLVLGKDPLLDVSATRKNIEAVMLDGCFIE